MTDLSLLLFLVAVAGLQQAPAPTRAASPPPVEVADVDVALSVWREDLRGVPLSTWLAEQPADARRRLAVTISYAPGQADDAMRRLADLRAEIGSAGANGHFVISEGRTNGTEVRLAQDAAYPAQ